MKLLLDTHAILWMISDDPRLSAGARDKILNAEDLTWSVASLWEIAIKLSLQKSDFRLSRGWEHLIPEEMARNGIGRLDLQASHCAVVAKLPWHHRDPFDRLLVAQAQVEKRSLLSCDPLLDGYDIQRVW